MVETIGNKLQRARLEKKIALEDAAYATKINAARLSDIETDVYTNFPNIAYAKGFLQIYSNYLGVDAQPYLSAFEDANTFGLDDYQYLSDVPVAQFRAQRRLSGISSGGGGSSSRRRRRRSRQLLAAAVGLVVLAFGGFAWYLVLSFQRLGNLDQLTSRQAGGAAAVSAPAATGAGQAQTTAPSSAPQAPVTTPVSTAPTATDSEKSAAASMAAPPASSTETASGTANIEREVAAFGGASSGGGVAVARLPAGARCQTRSRPCRTTPLPSISWFPRSASRSRPRAAVIARARPLHRTSRACGRRCRWCRPPAIPRRITARKRRPRCGAEDSRVVAALAALRQHAPATDPWRPSVC